VIDNFVKELEGLKKRRENNALDTTEHHKDRNSTVRKSYKIYSKIIKDYLWIVVTDKERKELISEGIRDVIYTQAEVSQMIDKGVSKEWLAAIHKIKKAFTGSRIEDIVDEDRN
jgi:hypothetical protein